MARFRRVAMTLGPLAVRIMSWPVIGDGPARGHVYQDPRRGNPDVLPQQAGHIGPGQRPQPPRGRGGPVPAAAPCPRRHASGLSIARLVWCSAPGALAANAGSSAMSLIVCGPEDS